MKAYFDYNATAPLLPQARAAWLQATETVWANPSALYGLATAAHAALEDSRVWVADQLSVKKESIVFTSGATEAITSVFAAAAAQEDGQGYVALSTLEHPVVQAAAKHYFQGRVLVIPCNASGVVDIAVAESLIQSRPIRLVALMAAHNELGTLQPWQELALICRKLSIPCLVDAVQWVGRMPSEDLGIADWVVIGSHKLGGPRGVGVLKIPDYYSGSLLFHGGGQEFHHRSGTENVAGILAFVAAWKTSEDVCSSRTDWAKSRNAFENQLLKKIPKLHILGQNAPRLWNTSALIMPEHAAMRWVKRLDKLGFVVGTGAACSSLSEDSQTVQALGLEPEVGRRMLRISSGLWTLPQDWDLLAEAISTVWEVAFNVED